MERRGDTLKITDADKNMQDQKVLNMQKALMMAKERLPQADYCVEYTDAYVFSIKGEISFGGNTAPVVVMKKTGEIMGMTAYVDFYPDAEILKEIEIPAEVEAMTYEKAKLVATERYPKINSCREYSDAYYFYDRDDKSDRTNTAFLLNKI